MPWTDDQIRKTFENVPSKGEAMVKARHIMGRYLAALENGTVHFFLPSPGEGLSKEYVEKAIQRIDEQWDEEWKTRGLSKGYARSAEFGTRLPWPQKVAMVQELRLALRRK